MQHIKLNGILLSNMSSTTAVGDIQRYWCHECEMSSSLHSTATTISLLCPYCHCDFIEEMDSPLFNNPNPNPIPTQSTPSGDDFLPENSFLQRISRALRSSYSDGFSPSFTAHHSQTSKTNIEAIPTVVITDSLLSPDPIIICAVCMEQLVIDDQTKQLPCKHLYHPDCILPWLSNHNTCPVCRFQLPVEGCDDSKGNTTRNRIRNGWVDIEFDHMWDDDFLFTRSQIWGYDAGLASPANSMETLSSWLPVEGEVGFGIGGRAVFDEEMGVSVSSAQGNDQIWEYDVGLASPAPSMETLSFWPPVEGEVRFGIGGRADFYGQMGVSVTSAQGNDQIWEYDVGLAIPANSMETLSFWPPVEDGVRFGIGGREVFDGEMDVSVSSAQGNDSDDIAMF